MKQSQEIGELAKSLIAVQAKLKPIVKDSTNPHFKNKYASLDGIMGEVRPALTEENLALVQGGSEANGGVCVTTMLIHGSGQWISFDYQMPLEKPTAQSVGSAITYGRRYGVCSILGLATEEDDDGNAASSAKKRREWRETPARVNSIPELPTDEQLQQIQELALATDTWESAKSHMKTLTAAQATDWIARLTRKLKEKE